MPSACWPLIAIPVGLLMAWVLTAAIQLRAFGWSMPFLVSASPLVVLVLGTGAAFLAALYPAWRASVDDPCAAVARGLSMRRLCLLLIVMLAACEQSATARPSRPPRRQCRSAQRMGPSLVLVVRATVPRPFEFPADHGATPGIRDRVVVLHR